MRTGTITTSLVVLLLAVMFVAAPGAADAAGTASNTLISNRATVNYEVSSVGQTPVESSPTGNATAGVGNGTDTTFRVDNRVNLTVATTDVSYVSVAPGSTAQVLTFTVTNIGNTVQDFSLQAIQAAITDPFNGNAADDFDATGVIVRVESNAGCAVQAYDVADTGTYIDELGADQCRYVYIISTIPNQANGDVAALALLATTRDGGSGGSQGNVTAETAGADTPGAVDVVFGDGADAQVPDDANRDGEGAARSAYQVTAATLTVTKSSAVYSDPFNGTTNPKAVPGAVLTYTVTVANAAGGAQATNVAITDSLDTMITSGYIAFQTQFNDGIDACAAARGIVVASVCNTNVGGDDNGDWNVTTGNTVTVSGLAINAGASVTIKYQAVIQ